jgi:hypothetical protein
VKEALPTNTSGAEIFKLIDEFFTVSGIPWDNYIDVCTDGAKAMTGKMSGGISRIKQKSRSAAVATASSTAMPLL